MSRLPPVLARDFAAHRAKIIVGLAAYFTAGGSIGFVILVTMGFIR